MPMDRLIVFALTTALISVVAGQSFGASTPLCPNPKPAPEFSFTLSSFESGSMKNVCATAVQNAVKSGFTSVTVVPARVFDGHEVIADGTVSRDELTDCLETIWASGLDVVFQPHLESDYIIHPGNPVIWRAYFDYAPDAAYENIMFGTFFDWLERHKDDLRGGGRNVSLVISAELETSTTWYPAQWWSVVRHLRQKFELLGLAGKVPVGFNPNWWPMAKFKDAQGCSDFKNFVKSVDFVAPSFYGDWSRMFTTDGRTPRGRAQVDENKSAMIKRLTYYSDSKCSVPELASKTFLVGEFGVGGDPQHAEQTNWDMMQSPDYPPKRRAIYANLIDWARAQIATRPAATFQTSINVWTGGPFDPVGIIPGGDKLPDGEISRMLNDYKSWRCGD
jgi:hypothetical protein